MGFEDDHAVLWRIFSRVVKLSLRLELEGKRADEKVLYNFHESVIDALKPALKEGIRTIVVTAPARTSIHQRFSGTCKKASQVPNSIQEPKPCKLR